MRDMKDENISYIIHKYSRNITMMAFAYTKNIADAEDITQEVFIEFFKRDITFRDEEHLKAWLLRVTINKSKNLLKSFWMSKRTDFPIEGEYMSEQDIDLINAVLSLDPKFRIPIHLYYYEGYSIQEIAQILNEKYTTIGTRLQRGREKLKDILGSDYHE